MFLAFIVIVQFFELRTCH